MHGDEIKFNIIRFAISGSIVSISVFLCEYKLSP